jgi:hypothetical protein
MTLQLTEENGGKLVVVHVSGKLVKADYEHFVPEIERLVRRHGKLRLLFDMTDFHGWEVSAAWEDFKFGIEHFADIERLAMVGEKQWRHGGILQAVHDSGDPLLRTRGCRRGTEVAGRGVAVWVASEVNAVKSASASMTESIPYLNPPAA